MGHLELKIFPPINYRAIKERKFEKNIYPLQNKKVDFFQSFNEVLKNEPNRSPSMVSSAHGRIKTLIFHYDQVDEEAVNAVMGLELVIKNLMVVMPNIERVIIITNDAPFKFKIQSSLKSSNSVKIYFCKVVPRYQNSDFSVWASDPYKAVHYTLGAKKQLCLIEPQKMIHRAYSYDKDLLDQVHLRRNKIAEEIRGLFHPTHHISKYPFNFDGGNILVGDDFVLIGGDTLTYNKEIDVELVFKNLLDSTRKPLFLKANPPKYYNDSEVFVDLDGVWNYFVTKSTEGLCCQPIYHLDLFITLGGEKNGKYQLVVGKPTVGLPIEKLQGLPYSLLGMIYDQVYQTDKSIEEIVKKLELIPNKAKTGQKFEIIRIPMPLTYHDIQKENEQQLRKWYWASYNNCIVEIINEDRKNKTVWIPSYADKYVKWGYGNWKDDLEKYEKEIENIWKEQLGFGNVHFINAHFHMYAQMHGSLGCLVNCIEREENE